MGDFFQSFGRLFSNHLATLIKVFQKQGSKDADRPGDEVVVEPLEVDGSPGLVQRHAPEDVVESRVGRDARDHGPERVQKVGSESVDLENFVVVILIKFPFALFRPVLPGNFVNPAAPGLIPGVSKNFSVQYLMLPRLIDSAAG